MVSVLEDLCRQPRHRVKPERLRFFNLPRHLP